MVYDEKENVLYETGTGEVVFEDFLNFRKEARQVNLKQNFRLLSNYMDANIKFTIGEMQQYAAMSEHLGQKYGKIKNAICVAYDLNYGLARIYTAISEAVDFEIEIFRSLEDAKKWLGLKE